VSIKYRLIEQKDDAALAKVIKTALEELDCAKEGTVYTDEATDHMSTCYQDEGSIYFIAEEDGVLIGGSGIAPIPNQKENYCELQRMFLSSKARGKGIGKALMDKCLSFAKDSGYDLVYLETFTGMPQAKRLYERSGFEYVNYGLGDTGHFSCDLKMVLLLKTEKRK
jgi:putative acetyltransferase